MRRRVICLALGLAAAASVSLTATGRLSLAHPAAVQQQRQQTRRKAAPEQARRKAAPAAQRPLPVRQIDAEGLKKLLSREGKSARPLLINFWATWCDPCREEFPDLVLIDKDYKARGLEFITVSLDDPADIKTGVAQFLRSAGSTMPAYLLDVPDPEPVIKFVDEAWGGALPATFLFDSRGQMVFKKTGRVKPDDLRAAIDQLMSDE